MEEILEIKNVNTLVWFLTFWTKLSISEKTMATHSSTLAWKIPWTNEPGRLQSVGSLRVRHDWATSLSLFTSMHWEGNGNPLQCSCLGNSRDRGAWWAAVYGVAQSRTRLKRLSSSSRTKWKKKITMESVLLKDSLKWRLEAIKEMLHLSLDGIWAFDTK